MTNRRSRVFRFTTAFFLLSLAAATQAAPSGLARPAKPTSSSRAAGSASALPSTKIGQAWYWLEKSDYARAEKELHALEKGADAPSAWIGLARLFYETGKYADSIAASDKAKSVAKNQADKFDAIGWKAEVLLAQGKVGDVVLLVDDIHGEVEAPRARAALVEAYMRQGNYDDASRIDSGLEADSQGSDAVYKDAAKLACAGHAAALVHHPKFANGTFKDAAKIDKTNVEMNVYWAQLFLDYYDAGHAEESVRDILSVAPNNPFGHELRAEVKLEQSMDWETADKELDLALAQNPELSRAYFVRGSMALHDSDGVKAEENVKKGLTIDPNNLDLYSLRAAIRYLDEDMTGYEAAKQETLKRNPKYSKFYRNVADFAEWEHRYDDIVKMMQEAVKLDPKDYKAWATEGFNLLRRGDETEGYKALDTSFRGDRFNVRVYNMLELFDKQINVNYELVDGTGGAKVFKFRFHKDEFDILGHYAPTLLGDAWAKMVAKYGLTPQNPVQIEVYPERQHFSVRTDGVPEIGPSGVCFGRLITAVSPKNEPSNWGMILWHELGHVFAIQLSKNRVPRWFTEGLSEYETIIQRTEWHRMLDQDLFLAMRGNRIPKIADMNHAFSHAKSNHDVVVAYFASSQIVVYIAETYKFPKIVDMLKAWGAGKKTNEVISSTLGISSDDLDTAFRSWLQKRYSRYDKQFLFDEAAIGTVAEAESNVKAHPNEASRIAELAAAQLIAGDADTALKTANQALGLDKTSQLAHYIAARAVYEVNQDVVAVKAHVQAIIDAGGDGFVTQTILADLAEAAKDNVAYKTNLEKAAAFDPASIEPLIGLYKLADSEKRVDDQLALLKTMAKLDPSEHVVWSKLLELLVSKSQWDEAIKVGESAVMADLYAPEVHAFYALALAKKGRNLDAANEIQVAKKIDPKDPEVQKAIEILHIY